MPIGEPGINFPFPGQLTIPGINVDIPIPVLRHPSSERFHALLKELGKLHDRKQQDYGSKDDPFANVRASALWGTPAWVGALMRLNDKVVRLQRFARDGELANESAEDSMRDIAVYALIALVLYEEATQAGGP